MDPKLPDRLLQAALKAAQAEVGDLPRTVGHSVVADVATNLGRSHTPTSRYELVELLGRGGMGLVWRAIDHDLQREVALKVLRTEYQISPAAIGRFVTESQIAGRLQHAGIVPVYELGTYPDGRVYLVMKLVHGQTLQDWLQRSPPIADRISVFVSLCQTMAYAHSQGVLHRDLKPVNIMLGSFGEVFVMDWGLATYRSSRNDGVVAASETRFDNETQAGAVLGTPDYLAPEHCAGTLAPWAETSDVYSLGVILFELLTQKRWVEQRNPSEVDDPQLHAIVEKCVALTPSKRWPNAAALAAAMVDFRADQERRLQEANLARQAAEIRAEAERRRQRLWIALIASIAIGAVGLTTILTRNRLEKQARATAEANRLAMVETSVNDLLREADRFLANGQHDRAKPLIGKAEGIAEGESGPLQASVRQRLAEVQLLAELESIRLKRSTNPGSNTRRYSQYDRAGFVYDRDASEYFCTSVSHVRRGCRDADARGNRDSAPRSCDSPEARECPRRMGRQRGEPFVANTLAGDRRATRSAAGRPGPPRAAGTKSSQQVGTARDRELADERTGTK